MGVLYGSIRQYSQPYYLRAYMVLVTSECMLCDQYNTRALGLLLNSRVARLVQFEALQDGCSRTSALH